MTGIIDRQWKYEILVFYPTTILQHNKGLEITQDIHQQIQHWMDIWD